MDPRYVNQYPSTCLISLLLDASAVQHRMHSLSLNSTFCIGIQRLPEFSSIQVFFKQLLQGHVLLEALRYWVIFFVLGVEHIQTTTRLGDTPQGRKQYQAATTAPDGMQKLSQLTPLHEDLNITVWASHSQQLFLPSSGGQHVRVADLPCLGRDLNPASDCLSSCDTSQGLCLSAHQQAGLDWIVFCATTSTKGSLCQSEGETPQVSELS